MSRLEVTFSVLKSQQKTGLVTYIMAGDGGKDITEHLLQGLPKAGADIIELGMPFTDPMADGPSIQKAANRSLASGTTLEKTLQYAAFARQHHPNTPIILMGYYNPIFVMGEDLFIEKAASAGVDGLIIVDLPPEEDQTLRAHATKHGISMIRLTTPTTNDTRLNNVLEHAGGFIYHVSVKGITGSQSAKDEELAEDLRRIKARTALPVAIGFGIRTPEQARSYAQFADAVVVGSALVEKLDVSNPTQEHSQALLDQVRTLREALDR